MRINFEGRDGPGPQVLDIPPYSFGIHDAP
jgi:hypothetical protein